MKTILITNSDSGLGFSLVYHYVAQGDCVFAATANPNAPDHLRMLATRYPGRLTVLHLDPTQHGQISAVCDLISAKTGVLDLLINNAELNKKLYLDSLENAAFAFRMNAIAPIMVARKFVHLLQHSAEPKIVNLVANNEYLYSADTGTGSSYNYSASKQALKLYSQELSRDLASHGIEVMMLDIGCLPSSASKYDEPSLRPIMHNTVSRITASIERPVGPHPFQGSYSGTPAQV
jgi:NAD(P)-dependent dehydrogenase (short-subunit alcohol dehydrogenase family)